MDDQHINALLPNLGGRALGFRERPVGSSADHLLVRRAHMAFQSLVDLDRTVGDVSPNAVPGRRRELTDPAFELVQVRTASLRKLIDSEREQADELERFLNVPTPAETVVQQLHDQELRQWFRGLDESQARPHWDAMGKGENDAMLNALARFPMPESSAVRAREVFGALQRQRYRDRAQALDATRERAEWAEQVAEQIGRVLDDAVDVVGPAMLIEPA
jgi:hypothetical protein